ncbi:hypothetical protein [Nonomuraea endophytica]|uniref:hypothetical protein n=1 Tax=Nonomuraea endophytica TaxID=714136 RepID=UPI0037C8B7AE
MTGHPLQVLPGRGNDPGRRHERLAIGHLEQLAELRDPSQRRRAVLERYATIAGAEELSALLHRGEQVAHTQQLVELFSDLPAENQATGRLRDDAATGCLPR